MFNDLVTFIAVAAILFALGVFAVTRSVSSSALILTNAFFSFSLSWSWQMLKNPDNYGPPFLGFMTFNLILFTLLFMSFRSSNRHIFKKIKNNQNYKIAKITSFLIPSLLILICWLPTSEYFHMRNVESWQERTSKSYLFWLNSSSHFYYEEHKRFPESIRELSEYFEWYRLPLPETNYIYEMQGYSDRVISYAIAPNERTKSYIAGVYFSPTFSSDNDGEAVEGFEFLKSVVCIANSPGAIRLAEPIVESNSVRCNADSTEAIEFPDD
ncbi:type IV pilin-like G/H family protein [Laspinema palackyanum]|uniref:type IV pilin-like G/H family protein n=1 Tax=Laspinema palackyanum TaxID=3231601 RepID=UPI00345D79DF|nr:hypothetical protein [Laspinema sp. D2c]